LQGLIGPKIPAFDMHVRLLQYWWGDTGILPRGYTGVHRHHPRRATPEAEKELPEEVTVTAAGHQIRFQHRVKVIVAKDLNDLESPLGIDNPTRCHPDAIGT